jgi:hypothetical protein
MPVIIKQLFQSERARFARAAGCRFGCVDIRLVIAGMNMNLHKTFGRLPSTVSGRSFLKLSSSAAGPGGGYWR